ncbi:MAG TPA: biotin/lipoyl-containing protein [Bryobacteraceae bacterium]|jgi:biotin carboxyl carrier protein|nr:biotin/lipoyl-containing protein [Bryobacteraceae bacterium]
MKLDLTIDGREERIEVAQDSFQLGDGAARTANVVDLGDGAYSVLLDGRSYDAKVDGGVVTVCGYRFAIDVRDPRRWSRNGAGGGGAGAQKITTPMPGKVVRVLAAVGDVVKAGQGIVVVEAMKMQNEMKAGQAGKIVSLTAKVGATVTAGEALAVIEAAEAAGEE